MSVGSSRRHARGVTLVELMIAVAIVGILAAIAYPSYQQQVRRGNRMDGKAELLEASQELEKCFTRNGRYEPLAAAQCQAYTDILASNRVSEKGKYRLSFRDPAPRTRAEAFVLQATLEPNRPPDPECGVLLLDSTGRRGVRGDFNAADPTGRCW